MVKNSGKYDASKNNRIVIFKLLLKKEVVGQTIDHKNLL